MENLRLGLLKDSTDTVEEDEFYEEIEAPKFVDFTTPDRSRPDDRSWFCVRVGCDQNHEEVDPDALQRSFVLRVMAARSPNVGLRKALNRQAPRSRIKCPHSAPAKSAKDKISKFSTITSIPEKMARTKLKDHPITALRSTPSKTKAKVQHFPSEKASTAPRNKKCSTNQEPFRSVKCQKTSIGAVKNRSVAKALFLSNPKKTDETRTPLKCSGPVSEVCIEMKLNIRSRTKNVPSRYLCKPSTATSLKRTEETAKNSNKKMEGCSQTSNPSLLRGRIHSNSNHTATDGRPSNLDILATDAEEHLPTSLVSSVKESLQSATADATISNELKAPQISKDLEKKVSMHQASIGAATETRTVENATDLNDNKENASYSDRARDTDSNATNFENENSQSETCENVPHQAVRAPFKSLKEHSDQGGKHKNTTNPKPFRFRTDERGILKEANQERRQIRSQKAATITTLRHGEGLQKNGKPFHGLVKKTAPSKGVHNAKPNLATSRHKSPMKLVISKGKASEKSKNKTQKLATSRQTAESVSLITSRKLPASQSGRENHKMEVATVHAKDKRPTTVPKEPKFHRINLPKNCTKKPEMVIN